MASESLTPPPDSGGGYAKYLVVLLLVFGGGLGVYFATRKEPEPPKPAPAPIKNVERPTSLSTPTIEIPEDEPEVEDAAVPPPPDKKPARMGDPWSCSGELPTSDIRRVLAEHQSAIRSCYERQLRNNNQLQGDVKLQVRIGNDGKVTAVRTSGNLRDSEVKSCMQSIAKQWTFPAPSGGTCAVFDAPFKFTPKQ